VLLGGVPKAKKWKEKRVLSDVSTIGEIFGEIFLIFFKRSWCSGFNETIF
jgi:hypothetical protein